MSASSFDNAVWRKSSRSNGNGNCVEVAWSDHLVGARDSKQGADGPIAVYSRGAWASFLDVVKRGDAELR